MPDITMCKNNECPMKSECYRHAAIPNEYQQSYSVFQFSEDDECSHFMKIEGQITAHDFYLK